MSGSCHEVTCNNGWRGGSFGSLVREVTETVRGHWVCSINIDLSMVTATRDHRCVMGCHALCMGRIKPCDPLNDLMNLILFSPFCKQGNWGTERESGTAEKRQGAWTPARFGKAGMQPFTERVQEHLLPSQLCPQGTHAPTASPAFRAVLRSDSRRQQRALACALSSPSPAGETWLCPPALCENGLHFGPARNKGWHAFSQGGGED